MCYELTCLISSKTIQNAKTLVHKKTHPTTRDARSSVRNFRVPEFLNNSSSKRWFDRAPYLVDRRLAYTALLALPLSLVLL